MFILSLVKVQTVNFNRLANSFDTSSKSDSSHRRIQRFFASFFVDIDLISKFLFALIPKEAISLVIQIVQKESKLWKNIGLFLALNLLII